jgi:iron complex outermembrane recepter protein
MRLRREARDDREGKLRTHVSTLAITVALGLASPAFGQTTAPSQAPAGATDTAPAEVVVVTGQRGAINRARAAERAADSIVNVITADSIGEFPDQNVAESVRRVSGVNVFRNEGEGRTISVRGLPPSFTNVTVNGVRIGSVDNGVSDVQVDSVGSELLDQIRVTKAVTPDMDGDAIGGAVEMRSLSAFTRRANTFSVGVEGYYNETSEEISPAYSASVTRMLLDGTLGLAGSISFSERAVTGYELINDEGLTPFASLVPTLTGLRPDEIDSRAEIGVRERLGATVNVEYRPQAGTELFFRAQFTRLDDEDGRYQNEYETDQADRSDELNQGVIGPNRAFLGHRPPTSRTTGGPDIDKQIRLSQFVDTVWAASVGSSHTFGNTVLGWQYDRSLARAESPEGYRARFRIRNINLDTTFFAESTTVNAGAVGGRDPASAASYVFDSLLITGFNREDEIETLSGRIRQNLEAFGRRAHVEFGVRARTRDKFNDAQQTSLNPQDSVFNAVAGIADLRGSLATLPVQTINSSFEPMRLFPQRDALLGRMRATAAALAPLTTPQPVESLGQDFAVDEETNAVYAMGRFEPIENLAIVGGFRIENTTMSTSGFFLELNDNQQPPPGSVGIRDLGVRTKSFTEALPSIHVLWTPSEALDVRLSYNRGLQRPDFDDFANRISIDFEDLDMTAGNPDLEPLVADNFDIAVGWFPNRETSVQLGLFHKVIDRFFVEYQGSLTGAGITRPSFAVTPVTSVETTLNGGTAKLTGVEFAYSQNYTFLPGLLSGLFTQLNLTWIDSEADAPFVRPGETFRLPGQPDILANLSLGWENDDLTIRLAANHVGEALAGLSDPGSTFQDRFREAYTSVDLSVRYAITDRFQITLEGSNLNEARDAVTYRGTPQTGRLFQIIEDYGRTVTVGLRARF